MTALCPDGQRRNGFLLDFKSVYMLKYISPGSWFSLEYPDSWCEAEDAEDSFLFFNPEKWNGNFRISAYRGENRNYARDCMAGELKHTSGARQVWIGKWECVYLTENFREEGNDYTSHIWITGRDCISVECSFTVLKGERPTAGEDIVASLEVRLENERPWREVIPVRVLEINRINEGYDWAVSAVKKQLTKNFSSSEADIASIQKVMDSGSFKKDQRQAWESFGIAFGTVLVNEMDGMNWVTVIDGRKEYPALRFADTELMVCPTTLVWDKVKAGQRCDLKAEYSRIKAEAEALL